MKEIEVLYRRFKGIVPDFMHTANQIFDQEESVFKLKEGEKLHSRSRKGVEYSYCNYQPSGLSLRIILVLI